MTTHVESYRVYSFDQLMMYASSAMSVVETATRVRQATYRPQAIQHARRAYEMVGELSAQRRLRPHQAEELHCVLQDLQTALRRLGEPI